MPVLEFIRKIVSRPFIRRSAVFQVGSIGAMLVQAAAGGVLARILGPEEYGRYAIVMSLAAIGAVFLGTGAADAMAPVLSRARHGNDDRGFRAAILFLGKFVLVTGILVALLGVFVMPQVGEHIYHDSALGRYAALVLTASAVSTLLFTPAQL